MAPTKDDIGLAAERLHRAEKTRQQIRQLSPPRFKPTMAPMVRPAAILRDADAMKNYWR
jgi:2-keto-4-pentenoate hydratase